MSWRCKKCGAIVYEEDFMNALQYDGNKIVLERGQFPKCFRCGGKDWEPNPLHKMEGVKDKS